MRFFPQNFGTMKRILPGSSSPSHREGPGIEVGAPGIRPGKVDMSPPFLLRSIDDIKRMTGCRFYRDP